MRTLSLLVIAELVGALVGHVAAVPDCWQINSGFCINNDDCDHWIEFDDQCISGLKQWRCVWDDGPGEECFYYEGSWQYCWCGPGGNPYPCDCLLEGTPIALADGSTKAVEAIKVGDRVLAHDESAISGLALRPSEVTAVYTPFLAGEYFVINERIRMTGSHPVLSGGKWLAAYELRVGGSLTAPDGSAVPIVSVRKVDEAALVYTFEVALKSYVAHGIVVHNKETCKKVAYDGP